MNKKSKAKVLFLRGIFLKDCESFSDKFKKHILSDVDDKGDNLCQVYDTIPKRFTGLDTWPTTTNLKCWFCTCNFSHRPVFVPGREFSTVNGIFCSFPCSMGWINQQPLNTQWEMKEQLKELYYIFNGKRVSVIVPSCDKTYMKEYGGDLSRAKYIKKIKELEELSENSNNY